MIKGFRLPGLLMLAVLTTQIAACDPKVPPQQPAPPAPPPPVVKETPPPPPPTPKPTPTPTPPPPRVPTEDEIFAKKTLDDLNREQPLADVMFAYDVAELDPIELVAMAVDVPRAVVAVDREPDAAGRLAAAELVAVVRPLDDAGDGSAADGVHG